MLLFLKEEVNDIFCYSQKTSDGHCFRSIVGISVFLVSINYARVFVNQVSNVKGSGRKMDRFENLLRLIPTSLSS